MPTDISCVNNSLCNYWYCSSCQLITKGGAGEGVQFQGVIS